MGVAVPARVDMHRRLREALVRVKQGMSHLLGNLVARVRRLVLVHDNVQFGFQQTPHPT